MWHLVDHVCFSPRLRHRASPCRKGGTIVWLIPTRSSALRCAVTWGNRQTSAPASFRPAKLSSTSPTVFDLHAPISLNSTTTEQKYSTDISCTDLSLSRVPSANAPGFAPSHRQALRLRLSRLGLVASGRRQSASGRRACASPEFPP